MNRIEELEKQLEEEWLDNNNNNPVNLDTLIQQITIGVDECDKERHCMWREYAPNGFCRCIRSVMPNLETYLLYKRYREIYEQLYLTKDIICLSKEQGEIY